MLAVLRHRDFALLWLAGLVSETGDWLLITGLPIYVFTMTGSSLITATVFVVELVPTVLLGSFAGVLVDRWDHRRVMITVTVAQALLLLPLLAGHQLWVIYLVAASEAVLAQFFEPAKNAALPNLVSANEVVTANSLVAVNSNLGRLVGSSLGGLAVMGGSLTTVALGNAASFLIAAALIGVVRRIPSTGSPAPLGRSWQEGLRLVTCQREVRVVVLSAAVGAVAQGLFVVLFVVFVSRVLHGDDVEIGLLRGVQAIGGILGGLLLGAFGARTAPRHLVVCGALAFGVLGVVIWNGPLFTVAGGLYVGLFIAIGVPGVAYGSGLFSMLQQHVPASHLGRAFGAFLTVHTGFQALGMLVAGAMGDAVEVVAILNVQACLYLIAGAIAHIGLRTRRPADSLAVHD